jgi:hypothetical protein
LATNNTRYIAESIEAKAPNDTTITVYYIWDKKANKLVRTHHMKEVIDKNLEMLGYNG